MATRNQYPDWVEKYRTKGCTIRKVRNGYGLYHCTSVSVPGLPYPKSRQEYLGMVTEKDGFIPKKSSSDHPLYIEYGLSRLIWMNFKRDLLRSSFNGTTAVVKLGIIKYIFGDVNADLIPMSFVSDGSEEELLKALSSTSSQRIENVSRKINELLDQMISDPVDRSVLEAIMRCCVMDNKNRTSQIPSLPIIARAIIERYGLRYGEDKEERRG